MKTKNIAIFGLLTALAFILSYIENSLSFTLPIPGIKMGLANMVVIIALYKIGAKEAAALQILRIILVGFTFGSPYTMMFSFAGGLLSWLLMVLFQKTKLFSMVGISIIGGISHNIGQIIVSVFVVENIDIFYYLPFLLVSGVITGSIIGLLAAIIIKNLKAL